MVWPALAVLLFDQISKFAVAGSLMLYETVPVVTGFFNLVHTRNRGMAFGLMNRPDIGPGFIFLVVASIAAIVVLLIWFFRLKEDEKLMTFGLSLVLGGAAGNLIDRILFREVIDFIDIYYGRYHWPAFNIADSAITTGTLLIAACLLFKRHPER